MRLTRLRLVDYTVEQDVAQPRALPPVFREHLRGQDLTKFVAVDGKDPQAIAVDGPQLCVEGFPRAAVSGARAAGLPSEVDESPAAAGELSIYVRDRSPFVRFTGVAMSCRAAAKQAFRWSPSIPTRFLWSLPLGTAVLSPRWSMVT